MKKLSRGTCTNSNLPTITCSCIAPADPLFTMMKTSIQQIQQALHITADGKLGPQTLAAVAKSLDCSANWRAVQLTLSLQPDGICGPLSIAAIARDLGIYFCPTRAEIMSNRSIYGCAGDESQLINITPAYPLYYAGKPIRSLRIHKEIAAEVGEALEKILAHYGLTRIAALKLDQYDGCFNNRSVRGGSSTSMHAWGIALDFCAAENGNRMRADTALFAHADYDAWFDIWESVGARSFGRRNGRDYMHIEFISPLIGN